MHVWDRSVGILTMQIRFPALRGRRSESRLGVIVAFVRPLRIIGVVVVPGADGVGRERQVWRRDRVKSFSTGDVSGWERSKCS